MDVAVGLVEDVDVDAFGYFFVVERAFAEGHDVARRGDGCGGDKGRGEVGGFFFDVPHVEEHLSKALDG